MAYKDINQEEIEELVVEAKQGDTASFAKIYDLFVDTIYRYIYFKVGKEEALDLTETVFLKIWENLKSYHRSGSYFSAWIFRIAHNIVVDHYRLKRENLSLDMDLPDEKRQHNPIILTEQKISHELLYKAIAQLKKKYQQIIILKYINELDNGEIAAILRRSEGSLRILKFRALKALKLVLEQMNIFY